MDEGDAPLIPYLAHLLEVSALVWLAGGNENTAIAGLLHDTVEDQGHQITADQIETEFGTVVRELVEACSDGEPNQRRDASTWKSRKQAYLDRLRVATDDALLVTAADKVSNAQAIVTDVERHGAIVWERFNASPADISWYYQQVLKVLVGRRPDCVLTSRLELLSARLEALAIPTDTDDR